MPLSRILPSVPTVFSVLAVLAVSILPVRAEWRKELGTFRIGITEAEGRQYAPGDIDRIKLAFSKALGMPVEIFQAKDFPSLIDAQASSRIEYAVYTAQAYATAYVACECVEPLVAATSQDGTSGSRAALVLDAGKSLAELATSKGIGIPGRDSLIGFGVPLAKFQSDGSPLSGAEPWLHVEADMRSIIESFVDGKLDGFFAPVPANLSKEKILDGSGQLGAAMSGSKRPAKVVWLSESVPLGPHAVRKNLAPEAKKLLAAMIVGLAVADPELDDLLLPEGAASFGPVEPNAYDLAIQATKALANSVILPKP